MRALVEAGDLSDPELKRAMVVLGPRTLGGRRFEAVNAHDGLPAVRLPLDAAGDFAAERIVIQVTEREATVDP